MKKRFRSKVDFSKEDFNSAVNIGASGISMPYDTDKSDSDGFKNVSFGSLFGSMNDPKFYEGTSVENVIPKEEDFIDVPFRLISSTVVGSGSWKATDFGKKDSVLRDSMPFLEGKPLYKDHETDLDNWVGIVKTVKWSPKRKSKGITIPAGIDGLVSIDAKTNPKVARGVLLGSIFSNSVTVDFDWEMSHEFDSEDDFNRRVGSMGADNKMVRRVVTGINDYFESSLVWLGADPFAKAINDEGDLVNIDQSAVYNYARSKFGFSKDTEFISESKKTQEKYENKKEFVINFGIDNNVLPLSRKEERKQPYMKDKILLALIASFGGALKLDKESTGEEALKAIENFDKESLKSEKDEADLKLAKSVNDCIDSPVTSEEFEKTFEVVKKDSFSALKTEKSDLTKKSKDLGDEITVLKSDKTDLQSLSEVGKKFQKQRKEEAKRLYKLSAGKETDDSVMALFDKANDEEVEGLLKQYTKSATGKFAGKCKSCGSDEFTFQSTFISGDSDDDESGSATEDLRSKYDKPRMKLN